MVTYHIPTKANPHRDVEPQPMVPTDASIIPQDPTGTVNNIFCSAALEDKLQGTLYTDSTGALSAILLNGYQYFFVADDYDTNYIFVEPIANLTDKNDSRCI